MLKFLFLFFLSFGELYKIYFNSFCSYQSFTIKKVVTINPYLNQNNFEQGYEKKLSNEQNKLKRHLNISKQTEFSVIKGVVKVTKDINNKCNDNLKNKDNIGNDSAIIINNKNIYIKDNNENISFISINNKKIYNKDNNESYSVIFINNNKKTQNKNNNESDFVNLINKQNYFAILNNK